MSDTLSARGRALGFMVSGLLSSSLVSLTCKEARFVSSMLPGVASYLIAVAIACAAGGEV